MKHWSRTTALTILLGAGLCVARAQDRRPLLPPDAPEAQPEPARARLYLKDGNYQLVLSYKVTGKVVRYISAERNAAPEEIPLEMVDLPRTKQWARDHQPGATPDDQRGPVLSPELAKAEAARAARTPEVAPGLKLPEEDSVLVLDTFEGQPELIPLPQQGSDLNRETAHAVLKGPVNPASMAHRILDLPGHTADVQLHVEDPVFYVRIGVDEEGDPGAGGFVVDTHGASGRATPAGGSADSAYVLERLDPRSDARVVDSFRIALLDTGHKQPDVIELKGELLPGGRWLKLTPKEPLEFGEYALIEVLSDRDVNLNVWDFGVHSAAKENIEALRPEKRRPVQLEHR